MSIYGRTTRIGALIFAGVMSMGCALQAATITVDFVGVTVTNTGPLGPGAVAGSISFDTAGATSSGAATFGNIFSNINFTTGNGTVMSSGTPTTNRLTQVQLVGADSFLSTYAGAFGPTGVAGVAVASVEFQLRTGIGGDFFGSTSDLFSSLSDGQVLTLGSEIGFVDLVVRYAGAGSATPTILRGGNFSAFTVSVSDNTVISPVPLPAGAVLLLGGLGLLGCIRRRRRKPEPV